MVAKASPGPLKELPIPLALSSVRVLRLLRITPAQCQLAQNVAFRKDSATL